MVRFHALTEWINPRLHIWRFVPESPKPVDFPDLPHFEQDAGGFKVFPFELDHQIHETPNFKLFMEENGKKTWEEEAHNRVLPRLKDEYRFPEDVWFVHGIKRVLIANPFGSAQDKVRIHLITQKKFRDGKLYLWTPGIKGRIVESPQDDADGDSIYFDVDLADRDRHFFCFKFVDKDGKFEDDFANRLWCAQDGSDVWVHSLADHVASEKPAKKTLTVHFLSPRRPLPVPKMHLWQEQSDFEKDVEGELQEQGICRLVAREMLFTGRPYGFKFFWPENSPIGLTWENNESNRSVTLTEDEEIWTLEGDHEQFKEPPVADREITIKVVKPFTSQMTDPLQLDVWVNRSPVMLYEGLESKDDGSWSFRTFPEIVTSLRFRSGTQYEAVERHTIKIPDNDRGPILRFAVLDREDLVPEPPIFQDPPFTIERPGVWERDDYLRFAIHAPEQALVQLIGAWTGWRSEPISLRSTLNNTYWWAQFPVAEVLQGLGSTDYHGAFYKYLFNGVLERQDPAADWVEHSGAEGASRLVNHANYQWQTADWRTPGWEYLIIYEIHPKRFSQRFAQSGLTPFRQVAQEITDNAGYLRHLGVTAIELMPVSEFAGDNSWGYGPAFFYAVESGYGGPIDLKYLVDTCHQHGLALILDVVYHHAGTMDNTLWSFRKSFFDGDTTWGAMINFDHPQVIHFFEQNLRYLKREYRVDGFRFDHTRTINHSKEGDFHVKVTGSGGGWQFLQKLRAALRPLDDHCILIAENLPNEWCVTNYGGPMDSQWNDDFRDFIIAACKGEQVMGRVADALKFSHTQCDNWFKVVNYPESHDDLGDQKRERIVNVAGPGQGLRRNKVAAAATLLSRGIPLWFMGAESGEWGPFNDNGQEVLDLDRYINDEACRKVRAWWNVLCELRRGNTILQGPSPLQVHCAEGNVLAFSRGEAGEYFVVLNFGWEAHWRSLAELNLPNGLYRERLNSTWRMSYDVEGEDEHVNGGWDAQLSRNDWLNIPDYGVVVLEKRW